MSVVNDILNGKPVRESIVNSLNESVAKIKTANAVYTGGGIWLFYGELSDGNYFLTDDYGSTVILNTDPSDFDESLYYEWQQEHLVKELFRKERRDFCDALIKYLRKSDSSHRGGITDLELDHYSEYFKEEL